jgi:hypothetical protein
MSTEYLTREDAMPVCPKCRAEYQSGFTICADCRIDLIESLPQPTPEEIEEDNLYKLDDLAVLADFSNSSEAEMMQELLTESQIESTLQGDSDPFYTGSVRPVTLLVEKHNLESAREIYEAYFAGQEALEPESMPKEQE